MADYPKTGDPLVAALQRLLRAEGGHIAVGDKAGINDQSLYQIAYCRPDSKTNRPKSVGPSIRRRLDKAFPGWLDLTSPAQGAPSNGPAPPPKPDARFTDRREVTKSDWALLNDIKTAMESPRLAAQVEELRREAQAMEAFAAKHYGPKP